MGSIQIGKKVYELVYENRNGWNMEAFRNRYSEVLERYDFIVGDWGYNQLRLKGFFRDQHQKATKDSSFSYATDYINEYCNFGCAYFILEKKQDASAELESIDVLDDFEQEDLALLDEQVKAAPVKISGDHNPPHESRKKQRQVVNTKSSDDASSDKSNEKQTEKPKQKNKAQHPKEAIKSEGDELSSELKPEGRKEGRSRRKEFYQRKAARSSERKHKPNKGKSEESQMTTE